MATIVTVTSSSPTYATRLTLVAGDDYATLDARQIQFLTVASGTWPDLTAAAVVFRWSTYGGIALSTPATVFTATGASKRVDVELTDLQTIGGDYLYELEAQIGTRTITLARGSLRYS